jgi:hypothetical protein
MKSDNRNILDSLKKSGTGFNHPNGYFADFEEKLLSELPQDAQLKIQIDSEEELTDHVKSNPLDRIGKNHGFKVPEDYFEEELNLKSIAGTTKVISLARKNAGKWLSIAVAASFLLFFGLKFYTLNEKQLELSDLNNDEIENWIDAGLVSFNTYEIAEAFDDVDWENEMYSDEEMTDYLNQMDIEQLILDN